MAAVFCALVFSATESHSEIEPQSRSLFQRGEHCVAYKNENRAFVISRVTVIGKNCDVSSQFIPEVGDGYYFEIIVPIRRFQSGDVSRDADVAKILKADQEPNLVFRSKTYKASEWKAMLKKSDLKIDGTIEIGNEAFPVTANAKLEKAESGLEVDGVIQARFENFKLTPPKVWGGIIASAKKDLELHFHLLSQRTLGFDSLLP